MTGVERVITALNRQEPDVVPHWENIHDKKIREAMFPGLTYLEFVEKMDLDAYVIIDKLDHWDYEVVDESKGLFRDQWGALNQFGTEALGHPISPAIKDERDLDNYVPPDPDEDRRYETLREAIHRFKGERAVIGHVTDVFDIAKESLLGDVAYYKAIINNPDLVDRVNDIVLQYNLKSIKNQIECGIDVFAITGDFAMTKGPMVSPKNTARFLTPALKEQTQLAKNMGMPVFKHTDGNLWKIMDLLVETGIDGLHPIDPLAGMDMGEVKEKYGDRLCLMGNINCGATLSWEPLEVVRREVKDCIRKAGKGGGFICMSSNSIHSGVNPENYLEMVKTIREFGRYPLDLDSFI
jgi:uroporphyrinogen decarboxylase